MDSYPEPGKPLHLAQMHTSYALLHHGASVSYRNKTYVAFASEDLHCYRLMTAWHKNEKIDFDFLDAHDINIALDTSQAATIRRRLRERLANTKQTIVLISNATKPKAMRSSSFLYYEIEVIEKLNLPVVFANLNGSRNIQNSKLPSALAARYSINVSFQPKIIQYALDNYVPAFNNNLTVRDPKTGPYFYKSHVYAGLNL